MSSVSPTAPPPALKARLVCRIRPGVTERFRVQGEECLVGREPGLAVTVPVDGVSRKHARIRFDGRSYWIENMSPAGTFVNGSLVVRERLRHLDVVTLGKKVDLLFLLRDEAQSPSTTDGIVNAALVAESGEATEIIQGEITIGRSSANNVVLEHSSAVSKVHARIERSPQQLVLQDLGSSNGTFVNGERVMTALLKHGDMLSFANVVTFRVDIERGQVAALSSVMPAVPAAAAEKRPTFSAEWKTRYDWDSDEIKEIADLQAKLRAEDAERRRLQGKKQDVISKSAPSGSTGPTPVAKPGAPAAAKPGAPAKPAAPAAAKPAAPAAAKPAAPAGTPPGTSPTTGGAPAATAPQKPGVPPSVAKVPIPVGAAEVKPAVAAPAMPEKTAPAPASAPPPKAPAAPVAARPPAPAPRPAPPAAPAPAPPPPEPAGPATVVGAAATMLGVSPLASAIGPIREVRLTGPGGELAVTEPGDYNLGRAKDAPLRVDNPTVSRKHARIVLTEDRAKAYIQDTGGANGTRLNGVNVERLVVLSDGDTIGVGDVELQVRLKRG
jgi:pSer/pThr/pTyr-binding forkhead associated (FHA) protein